MEILQQSTSNLYSNTVLEYLVTYHLRTWCNEVIASTVSLSLTMDPLSLLITGGSTMGDLFFKDCTNIQIHYPKITSEKLINI